MIRIIGALLIVTASTAVGFIIASRYRNRPKEVRQWRTALQSMEAEIIYGRSPIEDVADHLSEQLPQPVSLFFANLYAQLKDNQPLQSAWREALESLWPSTSLKQPEKEILIQFGQTLGAQDAENQKKHIRLALSHLEREEQEALDARASNEKLMKSLGFLAGLLLVLLFI